MLPPVGGTPYRVPIARIDTAPRSRTNVVSLGGGRCNPPDLRGRRRAVAAKWMAEGRSYRELPAWQKGIDFVEAIYQATEGWPKGEMHGLANQLRRAAVSIPASVAAGQGRGIVAGFLDRLAVAVDALHEAQTHLQVARRLAYLEEPAYTTLL